MTPAPAFPYTRLLSELRNSPAVSIEDYYSIRPHKSVRLMVKLKQESDDLSGIYIFTSENYIRYLQWHLGSPLKVHSFENENPPWLFLDDSTLTFHQDLDKLIEWIKKIKITS